MSGSVTCYIPSELSVDLSIGLFFNELVQRVKNPSVRVLEAHEPGDSVLLRVKSRDWWSRTGREGDLTARGGNIRVGGQV